MELDQYLYKEVYYSEEQLSNLNVSSIIYQDFDNPFSSKWNNGITVKKLIYQWRKANQIHKWFETNLGSVPEMGIENCVPMYVEKEELERLLIDINLVLDKVKEPQDILPATNGFFFGSTDYDEYYFEELEDTKKFLEEELKKKDKDAEYYYSCWW